MLLTFSTLAWGVTHDSNFCSKRGSGDSPVLGFLQCMTWCESEEDYHKAMYSVQDPFYWLWEHSTLSEFNRKKCSHLKNNFWSGFAKNRCQIYWNTHYSVAWYNGTYRCWNYNKDVALHNTDNWTRDEKGRIYKTLISDGAIFNDPKVKEEFKEYLELNKEQEDLEYRKAMSSKNIEDFKSVHSTFTSTLSLRLSAFDFLKGEFLDYLEKSTRRLTSLKATVLNTLVALQSSSITRNHENLRNLKEEFYSYNSDMRKLCNGEDIALKLKKLRSLHATTEEYIAQHEMRLQGLVVSEEYVDVKRFLENQIQAAHERLNANLPIFDTRVDQVQAKVAVCKVWDQFEAAFKTSNDLVEVNLHLENFLSLGTRIDVALRRIDSRALMLQKISELRTLSRDLETSLSKVYLQGRFVELRNRLGSSEFRFKEKEKEILEKVALNSKAQKELDEMSSSLKREILRVEAKIELQSMARLLQTRATNFWVNVRKNKKNLDASQTDFFDLTVLRGLQELLQFNSEEPLQIPSFQSEKDALAFDETLSEGESILDAYEISTIDLVRN